MGCKVNGGLGRLAVVSAIGLAFGLQTAEAARQFEYLDRGVVAVRQNNKLCLERIESLLEI